MAGKISDLTALTGANVDVAADMLEIRDTSAGSSGSKSILVSELKTALGLPSYELLVYLNANQSITVNTNTDVNWSAEETDTGNIFSASSTFITIPSGVTQCRGTMMLVIGTGANASGWRYAWVQERTSSNVYVKGLQRAQTGGGDAFIICSFPWRPVTAGNRIYATAYTSGGTTSIIGSAINIDPPPSNFGLEFR